MDGFEVERRETLTREEAATRLRRIANLLSGSGEEAEFERGGMKFKVADPGSGRVEGRAGAGRRGERARDRAEVVSERGPAWVREVSRLDEATLRRDRRDVHPGPRPRDGEAVARRRLLTLLDLGVRGIGPSR